MDRRELIKLLGGGAAGAFVGGVPWAEAQRSKQRRRPAAKPAVGLSAADQTFLDELQRRGCLYFMQQADPATGQVQDRARAVGLDGALDPRKLSSIAATGFGLTALCIAHKRGYAPADVIEQQVARTMKFHAHELKHQNGFFCHFNDIRTGTPIPHAEYSSIDTSLLLCGVLTARAYFPANAAIVKDATLIYERVNWPWMLDGYNLFRMGWRQGSGYLQAVWNHYCELMMIPLLAMASPKHPVGPEVWAAWSRPEMVYDGLHYISAADPLFVHQYSHAWFDFRGKHDAFADYFQNSVTATRAHRLFCLSLGAPYGPDYWGISASDTVHGYRAWGGPPPQGPIDGSVVPYAAAGSLPFLPTECLQTLRALQRQYGQQGWGPYGFCDAMHPAADWYDADVLGIDLGIGVLMAENLRTGFVWETFKRNPEVAVAMSKAGFQPNAR